MGAKERNHTASIEHSRRFTPDAASALLPAAGTHPRSAAVYEHGTLLLKLFAPRGHDPQPAHTRDELYFVAKGSGWFVNGGDRHPIQAGDALFVPAGVPHRFEEFTENLTVWVVFYGPEGGEQ